MAQRKRYSGMLPLRPSPLALVCGAALLLMRPAEAAFLTMSAPTSVVAERTPPRYVPDVRMPSVRTFPFAPAVLVGLRDAGSDPDADSDALLPRDRYLAAAATDACPVGLYSCIEASSSGSFAGICCPYSQVCALDAAHQPACCPAGDVCTGTVPTVAATTASTQEATFIPNTYYSFPYIIPAGSVATTALADANACDAALAQCRQTFSKCTAALQGDGSNGYAGAGATTSETTAAAAKATTTAASEATTTATTATTTAATTSDHHSHGGIAVTIVISGSTTFVQGGSGATATVHAVEADAATPATSTTLPSSEAASVCSSLESLACGGLPSNTAGCSSLFSGVTRTAAAGGASASGTGFQAESGGRRPDTLASSSMAIAVVGVLAAAFMGAADVLVRL